MKIMIGIFDSGIGGLTTLRALLRLAPQYDYIFLGDSARAPYGNRHVKTVTKYTEEGVSFLFEKGASVVLIACNTASSDALRYLQKKYPRRKILGVLIPTVEKALEKTKCGHIGLVGTRGTITAKNYEKEINKRASEQYRSTEKKAISPHIFSVACPLLVPLIEEGMLKRPETRMILKKYIHPLKHANIDTLILGCTHYPLLKKEFAKKMGKRVAIIDSGAAQAEKFVEYLERHTEVEKILSQNKTQYLYTTDCPERFWKMSEQFLGKTITRKTVEKVEL